MKGGSVTDGDDDYESDTDDTKDNSPYITIFNFDLLQDKDSFT